VAGFDDEFAIAGGDVSECSIVPDSEFSNYRLGRATSANEFDKITSRPGHPVMANTNVIRDHLPDFLVELSAVMLRLR